MSRGSLSPPAMSFPAGIRARTSSSGTYRTGGQPRHYVTLFGNAAFKGISKSIRAEIENIAITIEYLRRSIRDVEGGTARQQKRSATEPRQASWTSR